MVRKVFENEYNLVSVWMNPKGQIVIGDKENQQLVIIDRDDFDEFMVELEYVKKEIDQAIEDGDIEY